MGYALGGTDGPEPRSPHIPSMRVGNYMHLSDVESQLAGDGLYTVDHMGKMAIEVNAQPVHGALFGKRLVHSVTGPVIR
jgi:hypothetical protein